MERGFSPPPSGNLLLLVHWKLVEPMTPSGRENELALLMKACPVHGCLCGVRIAAHRPSASLWYEAVWVP